MDIFIQLVINGLLLGGAYTIISLGLTLIFGVVRVVNFAHPKLSRTSPNLPESHLTQLNCTNCS